MVQIIERVKTAKTVLLMTTAFGMELCEWCSLLTFLPSMTTGGEGGGGGEPGEGLFACLLINVPATGLCISGTDLLRQFYVLPH